MKICLPKDLAQKFRESLKDGTIDPEKLAKMTSKERRTFFNGLVGDEYAQMTNSLFESKLLLKNQKQGMITWAKEVAGLKPEARRDLLAKIEKMENVLDGDQFLEDLAATKLGINITDKEAADITRLAKEATDARAKMEAGPRRGGDGIPTKEELEYGIKTVALNNYVNEIKIKAERFTPIELLTSPRAFLVEAGGLTKSVKSTLDNSAILRQGYKTVFSHPVRWAKNALKTFSDIKKVFQGKGAKDLLNAEIISDPLYETMKKAKLAVGTIEEAFPTRTPEKIPKLGKLFEASDAAYSGFLHRMRADLFKDYLKLAESQGVNISSKSELESIGKMVNALTGRGHLGALEGGANFVNAIFFSPRNLKSNIDFLTAHQFQKDVTPFVRKQAAKNLMITILGTAGVMATAMALWGEKAVETDPRSADFGKIKIGKTRFDVTGGNSSLATLAARLALNSTKSSTSGKITDLNTGKFGSQTRLDVLYRFGENKASPIFSDIIERLKGETFDGEDPTITNTMKNLFAPLSIANGYEQAQEKKRANLLLIILADFFGIGTSTY